MIMLKRTLPLVLVAATSALVLISGSAPVHAQEAFLERPGTERGQATMPADRVAGAPGQMKAVSSACKTLPLASARSRIVNLAAQEWAYFGFSVTDRTLPRSISRYTRGRSWRSMRSPAESRKRSQTFARQMPSIAGYWAATPGAAWALERQNAIWNRSGEVGSRWRDPWSAAFVSWVVCEAGVGQLNQFQRSIAHRTYIDQAINARDGRAKASAYVAYDMGESAILPGDLLCSGTRSGYTSIGQRRKQLGSGARTHCDIVVAMDGSEGVILAIGGNVYGTVSLKRLPAVREKGRNLHPRDDIFAHLKLKANPIGADALSKSATVHAMACAPSFQAPSQVGVLGLGLEKRACR
jgi:hypothetical protein